MWYRTWRVNLIFITQLWSRSQGSCQECRRLRVFQWIAAHVGYLGMRGEVGDGDRGWRGGGGGGYLNIAYMLINEKQMTADTNSRLSWYILCWFLSFGWNLMSFGDHYKQMVLSTEQERSKQTKGLLWVQMHLFLLDFDTFCTQIYHSSVFSDRVDREKEP